MVTFIKLALTNALYIIQTCASVKLYIMSLILSRHWREIISSSRLTRRPKATMTVVVKENT